MTDDQLDPRPVAEWNLPLDVDAFLAWLRMALPGANDRERLDRFLTFPAARLMPGELKNAVGSELEAKSRPND